MLLSLQVNTVLQELRMFYIHYHHFWDLPNMLEAFPHYVNRKLNLLGIMFPSKMFFLFQISHILLINF